MVPSDREGKVTILEYTKGDSNHFAIYPQCCDILHKMPTLRQITFQNQPKVKEENTKFQPHPTFLSHVSGENNGENL